MFHWKGKLLASSEAGPVPSKLFQALLHASRSFTHISESQLGLFLVFNSNFHNLSNLFLAAFLYSCGLTGLSSSFLTSLNSSHFPIHFPTSGVSIDLFNMYVGWYYTLRFIWQVKKLLRVIWKNSFLGMNFCKMRCLRTTTLAAKEFVLATIIIQLWPSPM